MRFALAVVALDPSCLDAAVLTFCVSSHPFPNQHLEAKFKILGGLTYLGSILPPLKSQIKLSEDIFHSGKVSSLELSVTLKACKSPGKMVLQSQATQKLWMASRQNQPPVPSCHPHPEEQWKQMETLAAEWGRGLDGQLAPWISMPSPPSS